MPRPPHEASERPYDPLDSDNLAETIVRVLEERPRHPLPPRQSLQGSGVYLIYYDGGFAPYRGVGRRAPIYVGKAIPGGSRTGRARLLEEGEETSLFARLRTHARSIAQARNLDVRDFTCRYLVLAKAVYIFLAESLLIRRYRPLWNTVVTGFGNNPVGGGRTSQQRSRWDTLHPGRPGASLKSGRETKRAILSRITQHGTPGGTVKRRRRRRKRRP
jgi:hypothetical protein